jgi:glycerol kinase
MTTKETLMAAQRILAVDQGTTSSRAVVFDHDGRVVAQRSQEFAQQYPRPGWVEHDPEDIWQSQLTVAKQVLGDVSIIASEVAAVGVTNQRETTIVWDRITGKPMYNAIVWQDRRTAEFCDRLKREGWEETVRAKTGLVIDPYFSATKLRWILDHVEGARERARRGALAFGTVDTFLIWRLTGGNLHVTDYSNASRTMLFNIHTLDWDEDLLVALDIPRSILPEVKRSSEVYGETQGELFGAPIRIAGNAGDQQAATFGQACFRPGMVKNTYGTGNFMLMNTGTEPRQSRHGLLTTIAWGIDDEVVYALEGSIFVTGAAVQWLRDELKIIDTAAAVEALALQTTDTGGVYLVPAFTGLGAPYWDPYARGMIVGLTRGTGLPHIARATLASVAYQSRDVLEAMRGDSDLEIGELRVDGGMVGNDLLMQFQADITDTLVQRPVVRETTALGAAYLAGLAIGFWESQAEIAMNWRMDREFRPVMDEQARDNLYRGWKRAVERARGWAEPDPSP